MKQFIFLLISIAIPALPSSLTAAESGILTGGQVYDLPDWFKQGFLEFDLEVSEASNNGKQVIAFLHLDECPYCVRMLDENFRSGESRTFIEKNFNVVGVNIKGALDLTWADGRSYTERELAEHLRIFGTPTIVFLDQSGDKVLQLNGYRDPAALRRALEYVQQRHYQRTGFADYLDSLDRQAIYEFAEHHLLQKATYFRDYDRALVVLFEDRYCAECARFHEKTLNHPDVLAGLQDVLFVRLDAGSTQPVVNLEGRMLTARQWMDELGLTFRPSLVMFNAGRLLFRADGIKYHHHLSEGLAYVKSGYLTHPVLREFKRAYRESLMQSGKNIDFSE